MKWNSTTGFSVIVLVAFALFFSHSALAEVADYGDLIEISSTSFLPSTITAGDVVSLAVDVKNRGAAISIVDLEANLDIGNVFEPVETAQSIALIRPGSTTTLVFKFRVKEDTLPGYYNVLISMGYLRSDTPMAKDYTIPVPVSGSTKNLEVTVEPRVINPGKQSELSFILANIGGIPITNVSFSWQEANDLILPLGSDNRRYVSLIPAGESATVTYVVAADPNIATGVYPLEISVDYTDASGAQSQSSNVGLIIGGTTDFELSAEILSSGELSLSIANVGSNDADAVVVRIPAQQGVSIAGTNTEILGNLDKGDFTIVNFETSFSGTGSSGGTATTPTTARTSSGIRIPGLGGGMSGQRPANGADTTPETGTGAGETETVPVLNMDSRELTLQIDYTDTTGERQTVTRVVALTSESGSMLSSVGMPTGTRQSQDSGILVWAALAVVAAAAAAYNKYRAKKNWKMLGMILGATIILAALASFLGMSFLVMPLAFLGIAALAWFFFRPQIERSAAVVKAKLEGLRRKKGGAV